MSADHTAPVSHSALPGWGMLLAGFIFLSAAWFLPANLKSVNPPLLRTAGNGTPSLGAYGRDLVDLEKIGPATLVLAAAKATDDPRAPALSTAIETAASRQPGVAAWGGWDPFIDPLFNIRGETTRRASTPVLTFFIPEKSRKLLGGYLGNSGSLGVQAILKLRELTATGRFAPASRAGGQPLDALILLSALLYQGERFAPSLQRELRTLAETATAKKELGDLEPFFLDLLSLGRRLDWMQLSELLHRTESTRTVGELAHLARVAPDQLALIYAAALFSGSADGAAAYLIQFGKAGVEDLKLALSNGQGAVKLLVDRQVPITRTTSPSFEAAAEFALLHAQLALVLKYLAFAVGAWFVIHGLEAVLPRASELHLPGSALPKMRAGALAVMFAGLLIVATEPFLLKAAPPSEYKPRLRLPVLVAAADVSPTEKSQPTSTMDSSTLLSVGLFASLQVVMYFICLVKIRDVARQSVAPLVKLKLMENEENLFDGGLYVGIAGTATALVLQVLGIIQPNLLAAYASNLFGIICVALVKIRHVRAFKRELILEAQAKAQV